MNLVYYQDNITAENAERYYYYHILLNDLLGYLQQMQWLFLSNSRISLLQ